MNNSFVALSRTIQDFNSDLSVYRPIHVQNIFLNMHKIGQVIFRINYEQKLGQKIFVHKTINYIYVFLALYTDLKDGWHTQPKI